MLSIVNFPPSLLSLKLISHQHLFSSSLFFFKSPFFPPFNHLSLHSAFSLPHWLFLSFSLFSSPSSSLHSIVPTGAGVQGESGDNRRRLYSGREKCDHHESPHPPGLDVPVVLSAQVQLPSSGEDLPQGCPEGCSWLRCVCGSCPAIFSHTYWSA